MKIVIVEDNLAWEKALKEMYRQLCIDVREELFTETYEIGEKLIDDIAHGKRFDLLSLDLNLGATHQRAQNGNPDRSIPGANGEDVLNQIRELEKDKNETVCAGILVISGLLHEPTDIAKQAFDEERLGEIMINPSVLKEHFGDRLVILYKTREAVMSPDEQNIALAVAALKKQLAGNKVMKLAGVINQFLIDERLRRVTIIFQGRSYEFPLSVGWRYVKGLIQLSIRRPEEYFSADEIYDNSRANVGPAEDHSAIKSVLDENGGMHTSKGGTKDITTDPRTIRETEKFISEKEEEIRELQDELKGMSESFTYEEIENLEAKIEEEGEAVAKARWYLSQNTYGGRAKQTNIDAAPNNNRSIKKEINRLFEMLRNNSECRELFDHFDKSIQRHVRYAYRSDTRDQWVIGQHKSTQ